jgi:beta-glucanase (GH16 family)
LFLDCPPDPALGTTVDLDLTKGAPKDVFKNLDGTKVTYDDKNGAVLTIKTEDDAPTMASYKYIFFGRVDVTLQAAPGAGVVTSFVLQSDDLDEIDLEWVGGDNAQVQTNYFSKGDTSTYDRGAYHAVTNPTGQFHTYSIDWTKDYVKWLIDGAVVRTLTYADAKGGSTFPQTPMQIKFGTWVAGKKNAPEGTVQWSGGYTNFANAPFISYYKEIKITDYAGGVTGAKQYIYGDRSGTWQSIKVDTVNGGSVNNTDSDTKTTTSAAPSSTGSATTLKPVTSSTVTVSNATITSASPSNTRPASTTTSGSGSQTSAPNANAAGSIALTMGNVALAGAALLVANVLFL